MSLAADTTWDATQGTQATMPKDPRPPALRLMAYRSNISKRDPARAIWCEETRNRLNGTPVRLSAQAPPKDSKAKTGKPSAPLGQQERIDARVKARGPSSLRHEVRPTEDTPAEAAHHHQKRRPDALLTPGSGAAAMPRRPGQSKGGLYGARRAPTTAPSQAQMAPARASATQARRAHISKDEVALLAMDIDEEPSHAAKPTGRALAERLYHRPDITRSEVTLSATRPGEPTSPPPDVGQMPLMRKRGRDEAGDVLEVAPHPKRLAKPETTQVRSTPGSPSAESGVPAGRHVQQRNNLIPPPSSRALSGIPAGPKTSGVWVYWMVAAWTAVVHALGMVTARLGSQLEASGAR